MTQFLITGGAGNPTPVALEPACEWEHSGKRFGDPTKTRERIGFACEA